MMQAGDEKEKDPYIHLMGAEKIDSIHGQNL